MRCANCNAEIAPNASFCTSCGTPQDVTEQINWGNTGPMPAIPQQVNAYQPAPQKKSSGGKVALIVIIVVLVAAIAVLATLLVTGSIGSKDEPQETSQQAAQVQEPETDATQQQEVAQEQEQEKPAAIVEETYEFEGVTKASATSHRASANGKTYDPSNMLDGSSSTCWCDGVSGSGAGESITFQGSGKQQFSGFKINAGYQSGHGSTTYDHYEYNNRAKGITVLADGEEIDVYTLDDTAGLIADGQSPTQVITFLEPVVATKITIVIDSVYYGSCVDEDLCISSVEFF